MSPFPERWPGERIVFTPNPRSPPPPLPPVVASVPTCLGIGLPAPPLLLHLLYHKNYSASSWRGRLVELWQSAYWARVGRELGRRMMINTIRWPVAKGEVIEPYGELEQGYQNQKLRENKLELFAAVMCRYKHGSQANPAHQRWRSDELNCGEDSFFLAPTAIGVADGVGGWVSKGVDPSEVANGLMRNAAQLVLSEKGRFWHPRDLLDYAHSRLWADRKIKNGSSTAVVGSLNGTELTVANFGDSRLLVLSPAGEIKFFAREQQTRFNAPLQLGFRGGNLNSWNIRCAGCAKVNIEPNDVIVVASDGIFDNLHPEEVAQLVARQAALKEGEKFATGDVEGRRDALGRAAYAIFNESMQVSEMPVSTGRRTPWWVHKEEWKQPQPKKVVGKSDDMTVVVAQAFTPEAAAALRAKGSNGPPTDQFE